MSWRPGPRASTGLALAAGALAALAHPPFGFLPGLLGYALLLFLVDQAPAARPMRAAFWRGWLAGFAYFLVGCWWVAEAFMVDARGQGWMAPIAVCLLPSGLGLFWGAAMALYRRTRPEGIGWRILAFAGWFTALEWVRGHLLTGFPWNLPGESWKAGGAVSQAASVVGAYGLTWITLAITAAFAALLGPGGRRRLIAPAVAAVALIAMWGWGAGRLAHTAAPDPAAPVVRIVQADVPQAAKYDEASFRAIFGRYVDLTAQSPRGGRAPDVVVWSEGAVPASANDLLAPGSWTAAAIAGAMHPGETLLMGAYREAQGPRGDAYFNSLIAVRAQVGGALKVTGVYDKYRLVPFGEYLPAESILQPLGFKNLTHIGDSFAAGPRPRAIAPEGLQPVQPLICYEALFPGFTREGVARGGPRPRWIVNVSNDAWFGVTSGPLQHLNLASYRAIEEGLPIVRATPTGVSALIDAYGRTKPNTRLGLGEMGVIDTQLPPTSRNTTYSRLGDIPLALLSMLSVFALVATRAWRMFKLSSTISWLCRKHESGSGGPRESV